MRSSKLLPANVRSEPAPHVVQSCGKPFLLSSENHPQNGPLPTQKLRYGAIFQPAIPETLQECFTPLSIIPPLSILQRWWPRFCPNIYFADSGEMVVSEQRTMPNGEGTQRRGEGDGDLERAG